MGLYRYLGEGSGEYLEEIDILSITEHLFVILSYHMGCFVIGNSHLDI